MQKSLIAFFICFTTPIFAVVNKRDSIDLTELQKLQDLDTYSFNNNIPEIDESKKYVAGLHKTLFGGRDVDYFDFSTKKEALELKQRLLENGTPYCFIEWFRITKKS